HGFYNAASVWVPGSIDPANNSLLPVVKLERLFRCGAVRMLQAAKELNRPLAIAERIINRAAVKDPRRIGACHYRTANGLSSSSSLAVSAPMRARLVGVRPYSAAS